MSIQSNIFCWHGISTNVDLGKAFYPSVLGWGVAADSEGPPTFVAPGGDVAHLQAPENTPPSWCSFLSVADVDASTARAAAEGGGLLVPPTDLSVGGRFSVVTTPSGGVFGLYQACEEDDVAAPGPGSVRWVELQSTAVEQDVAWFASVFGFSSRVEEMEAGPYHVLEADGVARGGVMASRVDGSVFTAWVQVDDIDATLAKVGAHGGQTLTPAFTDASGRRMAVVSDPGGASFGLVQPA